MDKKKRIKELLNRLNAIDTPKNLADVKFLDVINSKLDSFKTTFNLKPVSASVNKFQDELNFVKDRVSKEFGKTNKDYESKLQDINTQIQDVAKNSENSTQEKIAPLLKDLTSLRKEFTSNLETSKQKESSLNTLISGVQDSLRGLSEKLNKKNKENSFSLEKSLETSSKSLADDFNLKINKLKLEVSERLNNVGGGSMNRQISINSSVMSTKYTDINLIAGSVMGIATANNDTTKQVDITLSQTGGIGTVTSVSVVTANGVSGTVANPTTTPAITLTLGAITPSSVNVSGLTASEIVITDASKNLTSAAVATYPSLTELTYLKGVTSDIQTQLGLKAPLASPTFTTQIITPLVIGGTATTADLTLQTTSGVGVAGADMHFLVGNNGATEAMTILNSGNVGIGTTAPGEILDISKSTQQVEPRITSTDANGYPSLNFFRNTSTTIGRIQAGVNDAYNSNGDNLFISNPVAGGKIILRNTTGNGLVQSGGNVGIGTTGPTNLLSLDGNSARIFWMERHTTANTAGNTLTITAGGATSAATDKAGGALILQGGLSTGSAESGVTIQGCVAGATGTADRTQTTVIQVLGNKIGFYAVTPVVRPTALTTQLTSITHTSPGTPDYAIQDLTQTTPFGFVTKDEGNTVLSVILNLQTRVSELETKLQGIGLLT